MKTEITKIQRFSTHDGDGVRTTVFFRGCPLRCKWCHNPETLTDAPPFYFSEESCIECTACADVCPASAHIFGEKHTVDREKCTECLKCTEICPTGAIEKCALTLDTEKIMETVLLDRIFYGKDGGITLSGGEPMAQPEAAIALLANAKDASITTAMETSGVWQKKYVSQLSKICDLFLWDIKDGNEKRLRENTGANLSQILENLYAADNLGCVTELRCIMIKGVNMDTESFSAIAEIYKKLRHCRGIKLLPFHPYGSSKYTRLGMEYAYGKECIPTNADLKNAKRFFREHGVIVIE